MTAPSLRVTVRECGCLVEQPRWSVMYWARCVDHRHRFVRVQMVHGLRRCESCRQRMAMARVEFADGSRWLVCRWCEPWRNEQ